MLDTLDVSRLPTSAEYGTDLDTYDLSKLIARLQPAIEVMAKRRLIKDKDSFGCAVAKPTHLSYQWDDPYAFTWFVAGWGKDPQQYIANAVRKLRPGLREGEDTLTLRTEAITKGEETSSRFRDVVGKKEADGSFKWGDFPWGGMTFVRVGNLLLPVAVSCLFEVEDDAIAKLAGGLVGAEMLKIIYSSEFGPNS